MKKILVVFLIFFTTFLFGNEFVSKESSAFKDNVEEKTTNVKPQVKQRYYSKNLYLSYSNYPNHVYKNQRFEVGVKALITRKNFDSIKTRFIGKKIYCL